MSIALLVLLWAAGAVALAGHGMKRAWLAALLAFPLVCAVLFALEPSFGAGGGEYLRVAVFVACHLWAGTALISALAWFALGRTRAGTRRG